MSPRVRHRITRSSTTTKIGHLESVWKSKNVKINILDWSHKQPIETSIYNSKTALLKLKTKAKTSQKHVLDISKIFSFYSNTNKQTKVMIGTKIIKIYNFFLKTRWNIKINIIHPTIYASNNKFSFIVLENQNKLI